MSAAQSAEREPDEPIDSPMMPNLHKAAFGNEGIQSPRFHRKILREAQRGITRVDHSGRNVNGRRRPVQTPGAALEHHLHRNPPRGIRHVLVDHSQLDVDGKLRD